MKKALALFSVIALIAMVSCEKDESDTSLNDKDLINEIFIAGMSWNSELSTLQTQTLKSTFPINIPVDMTSFGSEGGNIHVIGSVTGSMGLNDVTNAFTGGFLSLGLTETITDYAFISNSQKYTMNGAPYISLTGTFTLQPDYTFGTASSMQIGGGIQVVGPGYNQTVNINITIIINSNGTGGSVSGTMNDKSINYNF